MFSSCLEYLAKTGFAEYAWGWFPIPPPGVGTLSVEVEATSAELNDIAEELYTLKPDGFAAARDQHVKRLKAEGQKDLANELSKLRRPTQSAWLVNLLWRDQREVMEQLFELSADLGRAQARSAGAELRELTTQRRQIEAALLNRARALGSEHDVSMSAEMEREVQETLSAALAEPEAADEVRTGRLVKPIEYAGFGTLAAGSTAAAARNAEPRGPAREPTPLRRPTEDERKEREARERVQDAQRAAIEAGATVEAARREAEQRDKAVAGTREKLEQTTQELERLRKLERDLEDDLSGHERASRDAKRQLEDAQKEHAAALRALEKAEQELAELKR